jgi:hypothetical protein
LLLRIIRIEGMPAVGFGTAWVREKIERKAKRSVMKVYMMMMVFPLVRLVGVCALLGAGRGWRLPRSVEPC